MADDAFYINGSITRGYFSKLAAANLENCVYITVDIKRVKKRFEAVLTTGPDKLPWDAIPVTAWLSASSTSCKREGRRFSKANQDERATVLSSHDELCDEPCIAVLYVAQIIVYEPEEKTEESLCGLLRVATPGWTDNIFSRCKLVEVSNEVVRFSVQMDEDNLPPTIRGLEGEELLLNVAQLLHGDRNACRISTVPKVYFWLMSNPPEGKLSSSRTDQQPSNLLAKEFFGCSAFTLCTLAHVVHCISREYHGTTAIGTYLKRYICSFCRLLKVKGKSYLGTTVRDCQLSSIVFAMDQAWLRTYRLVLSPDATWWRAMQVLRALNGFVGRCRYNGHPTN
ncbi:hypothetical protein CLF_109820 [Clonorchis sinensis]|uniref:Uncharacterized protein n=1 Tax=Clonorchis sinensis TaxID=79923 RepID=G7YSY7_CLOSI|nr:hypothetical protein CLF_109820 [Clonorchis sinensis]